PPHSVQYLQDLLAIRLLVPLPVPQFPPLRELDAHDIGARSSGAKGAAGRMWTTIRATAAWGNPNYERARSSARLKVRYRETSAATGRTTTSSTVRSTSSDNTCSTSAVRSRAPRLAATRPTSPRITPTATPPIAISHASANPPSRGSGTSNDRDDSPADASAHSPQPSAVSNDNHCTALITRHHAG